MKSSHKSALIFHMDYNGCRSCIQDQFNQNVSVSTFSCLLMTFEQCRQNWWNNWIPSKLPDPARILKCEGWGDTGEIAKSSAHKVTGWKPTSHFLWSMLAISDLQMCEGLGKAPRIKSEWQGQGSIFCPSSTPCKPLLRGGTVRINQAGVGG